MTTAALIAEARERAGLTQRQLAERTRTSAAAICEYEAGRRVPRVDTLERILAGAGGRLAIEVRWPSAAVVDIERNGRVLEDLLDLVDHLPHRRPGPLAFPPFAQQAR
jgi:transcriptional regulator with XRE-family HTH domain